MRHKYGCLQVEGRGPVVAMAVGMTSQSTTRLLKETPFRSASTGNVCQAIYLNAGTSGTWPPFPVNGAGLEKKTGPQGFWSSRLQTAAMRGNMTDWFWLSAVSLTTSDRVICDTEYGPG